IYSQAHPAVVVDESEGNTNVAMCSADAYCNPAAAGVQNNDSIRVRLSAAPAQGTAVTVSLGDHAANLVQYFQAKAPNGTITFSADGQLVNGVPTVQWDQFVAVEVRAVSDLVIRGFHKADLVATALGYADY